MSFIFLSWGKGKNGKFIKNATDVSEGKIKTEIQKVYVLNECNIFITQGEIFKEGYLPFERKDDKTKSKNEIYPVMLNKPNPNVHYYVSDISLGDNHAILYTKTGLLFSWGDNYYGQLGLGSFFIPYIYEPHLVKLYNIEEIMCYKNNSYAVDTSKKLWVWGKCDLLGINYRGNLFKPTQILSNQFIQKMKVNDGRIIIEVKHYKTSKKEIERKTQFTKNEKPERAERDISDGSPTGRLTVTTNMKKEKSIVSKKDDEVTSVNEGEKRKLIDTLIKIDSYIKSFFEAIDNEMSSTYKDLSLSLKENHIEIKKYGWENIWESIEKIIINTEKNIKQEDVSFNYTDSTFLGKEVAKFFKALIKGKNISLKNNNNELLESIINDKSSSNLKEIKKTLNTLLNYNFKLRKVEFETYMMASFQFLFKSTKFTTMIDALNTLKERDADIDKRLFLICKLNDSIKLGTIKYKNYKVSIENSFKYLPQFQLTNNNEDNSTESFCYKYLIDISTNTKYLWEQLISNLDLERSLKEQVTNENSLGLKYKEIFGLHIYLNTLGINSLFDQSKQNSGRFLTILNEVDGLINQIDNIIVTKYEQVKENEGLNLTNELNLSYLLSLLDVAYLKKYLIMIQKSVSKQFNKIRDK